jgi:hypothetical protein
MFTENGKKIWSEARKFLNLQRVFHSIRFKVNKGGRSGAHFFVLVFCT